MSIKLTSYVWEGCSHAGLKLTKVAIMARLADFSNDEGVSWPSIETISRQIGAGESTVRSLINELERDGWLKKTTRRKGNRNGTNIYTLNVKRLRDSALSAESKLSKFEPLKSDPSKFDPSDFDPSKSRKSEGFDPPESGGDPLDLLKHDPLDINTIAPLEQNLGKNADEKSKTEKTEDPEVEITDKAIIVLEHLNRTTGSKYQKSKSSLENIRARLRDGYEVEQLTLVIDYKQADWGDDIQYSEYLRPSTLFSPSKFVGYLSSADRWNRQGRPPKINGKFIRPSNQILPATNEKPAGWK